MTDHRRITAYLPVSSEVLDGAHRSRSWLDSVMADAYNGFTRYGPTEPVSHWVPPEQPRNASPEWEALYDIATEEPSDCCDCMGDGWAIETARDAIGGSTGWSPGPRPGRVPGMFESFDQETS
jgi:hypothetical protein